jgi:large repetitive protein
MAVKAKMRSLLTSKKEEEIMEFNFRNCNKIWFKWCFVFALGLLMAASLQPEARAANLENLTVMGVGPGGVETPIGAYRWLVQEDKTYHVQTDLAGVAIPTVFDPNWEQAWDVLPGGETLSVGFHQSYMPVVAKGCVGFDDVGCSELAFDPVVGKQYYVSVVPRSGASIGGAKYDPESTTVYVNQHPIPTAQITIFVFPDMAPLNNAPDLPSEQPGTGPGQTDMSGFKILVEDAGGRFGVSAGTQSQDAFGNSLGTTYKSDCNSSGLPDGNPNTNFLCYDSEGNPIPSGTQELITGPDGRVTIKNLAPGKYGIQAIPPAGSGWQQTSTIEGTKVIDAWVKANEPPFFAEFGPPGFHVFVGFIKPFDEIPGPPEGASTATITGTIVNQHLSRPPDYAFYNGGCFGHTTPWVGLNSAGGLGPALYAAPTQDGCSFEIPNVPDGSYQLVVWDNNLDLIFTFLGITIEGGQCNGGPCSIGDVPVFQWFHRQEHRVFDDINGNGMWDYGEPPMVPESPSAPETAFNLRWRDGTIYQTNVSDGAGAYAFDQVFPFFSWLVAEVDFARFKATGLQVVVDDGGAVTFVGGEPPLEGLDWTFGRAIAPQDQTNPADPECGIGGICEENETYRVERGPVLTQGFQGFLGQTNAFLWGKRHYPDGENGGISGMVFYAVTRAENDPRYAVPEVWEPGIPGVTVNLYNADGTVLLATTTTDSWDDAIPIGCKHGNGADGPFQWTPDGENWYLTDCYDGLRNFNQARPAVFDGGYAFGPEIECPEGVCPDWVNQSAADPDIGYMKPGDYVVEVIPPPGYEIVKEEDKNVDFGDEYQPAPELLPAVCVGEDHLIPPYLTLFPDEQVPSPFAWATGSYQPTYRPLCDRKLVTVEAGANRAADFFLFTEVPVAAQGFGFILDDTGAEFDPSSPQFGEKYAPPFVPVTVRDWTGRQIGKTLSDQYGRYNFLAPSTITANLPQPSGMSPNMLTTCMNDPGDDPDNPDPNWNQLYSTFCYTFQYMPGVTTYLDTPVVPVAAFTGPDQFPLDCEYPDGTPRIYSVDVQTNGVGGGPYIPTAGNNDGNRRVSGDQTIIINSLGTVNVPNPEYCNPAAGPCPADADTMISFVSRDYGFGGDQGTVTLGGTPALPLNVTSWSDTAITATVPANTPVGAVAGRQLTVTRTNGLSTRTGVTVQVGLRQNASVRTVPGQYPTIQAAIQAAGANDLILVGSGSYNEMVVMWKPVQIQGWGEGSTTINALKAPPEKLQAWRSLVDGLIASGAVNLLPGQQVGPGTPEPTTLWNEEGAGVLVLGSASGNGAFSSTNNQGARFDGFTIKSADTGGGIIANGYNGYLQISNNRISNNSGFYGGGIRVGHPFVTVEVDDGLVYTDAQNDFVRIHHNQVVFNGGLGGAGGGISMCTGADSYQVTENWVCGNFSARDGGGIGHIGYSDGVWATVPSTGPQNQRVWTLTQIPTIANNTVIFNESFFQGQTVSGGGISIAGAPALNPGGLSPGAGNVRVIANLVQGNSAGAGDGGGIRLAMVNGQDVAANPTNAPRRNGNQGTNDPAPWHAVDVFNNMVVNNVAALAGGGISLQDAVYTRIVHNTIANNDSLATAGEAFAPGSPNQSTPQPGAGIVSRGHSPVLAGILGAGFSSPTPFADNIVSQNRQFYFQVEEGTAGVTTGLWGLCPDIGGLLGLTCEVGNDPVYSNLGVIGAAGPFPDGTANLIATVDPGFVESYFNGARSNALSPDNTTAIQAPPAFDEGGNFIKPVFGPLSLFYDEVPNDGEPGLLFGDYHILGGSTAVNAGTNLNAQYPSLATDFDGQARPNGAGVDIGADEYYAAP